MGTWGEGPRPYARDMALAGATAATIHLGGVTLGTKADLDLSEKGTGCKNSRPRSAMSQAYGGITA